MNKCVEDNSWDATKTCTCCGEDFADMETPLKVEQVVRKRWPLLLKVGDDGIRMLIPGDDCEEKDNYTFPRVVCGNCGGSIVEYHKDTKGVLFMIFDECLKIKTGENSNETSTTSNITQDS